MRNYKEGIIVWIFLIATFLCSHKSFNSLNVILKISVTYCSVMLWYVSKLRRNLCLMFCFILNRTMCKWGNVQSFIDSPNKTLPLIWKVVWLVAMIHFVLNRATRGLIKFTMFIFLISIAIYSLTLCQNAAATVTA